MWLINKYNVLPTDERYLNLTVEQRALLWESFLLSNPQIQKAIDREQNKIHDEEFEKEWQQLELDTDDVQSDWLEDIDTESLKENFNKFVEDHDLDIKYRPQVERLLKKKGGK